MNINIDTDVNESRFDDLAQYYEITTPELLDELIGVPIILNHYTENINDLLERIVTITAMCWGNEDERGNLLHQRLIPFKVDTDDEVTYHLQLNRLMVVLVGQKKLLGQVNACRFLVVWNNILMINPLAKNYLKLLTWLKAAVCFLNLK